MDQCWYHCTEVMLLVLHGHVCELCGITCVQIQYLFKRGIASLTRALSTAELFNVR